MMCADFGEPNAQTTPSLLLLKVHAPDNGVACSVASYAELRHVHLPRS